MTRHVLAIGALTIVLSWSIASGAEDAASKDRAGRSRGINPSATTTTTSARFVPGDNVEERELVRPHRSMLITGSAILLGSYAATATMGAISDTNADKRLFVPLVGPWLDLGDRQCALGACGLREDVNILHIIGSGAAQAAGLGIAIGSLFVEERRSGRPAPQRPAPEPPRTTWHIVPAFGGIGAAGTF